MNETDKSVNSESSYEGSFRYVGYLEKIQSIVHHRRGFCFSYKIENQNQKLLWQCAEGHQWRASATSILHSKSWCPVCAGNQTLTINEMSEIAKSRGGRCLSKTYTNSKTRLRWLCDEGHIWYATPFSIKNRESWCPICYKMKKTIKIKKMKALKRNYSGMILLAGMVFIFSQCSVIKPGFNGVLNKPLGDGIKVEKVYEDGFTWKSPWNRMIKYNIQLNSYQENVSILSSDELHTTIALSVILRPIPEKLPYLALEIGDDYYTRIVKPEFFSVSRSITAEYPYNMLSIKSPEIENRILEELKSRLEGKHIELNKVTLDHIMYSPVVTRATDQKLATQQQVEQKSYEIEIAEKEAEIQRINARGQRDAQQIIDQGLTQQYLQFKALEVQNKLSESSNSTFYFVPLGNDGLPIIIDTSSK